MFQWKSTDIKTLVHLIDNRFKLTKLLYWYKNIHIFYLIKQNYLTIANIATKRLSAYSSHAISIDVLYDN